MTMRTKYTGRLFVNSYGSIKVTADEETGEAFEIHFLDRVIIQLDFSMNHRIQRSLLRHRKQAQAYLHVLAKIIPASFPLID